MKCTRFLLNTGKHVVYCPGDQTLAKDAKICFGVFLLVHLQKLPGHVVEQLDGSARAGVGPDGLLGTLPTSVLL